MALDKTTSALLRLLEKDIMANQNIGDLPSRLLAVMRDAMKEAPVDLDEDLRMDDER
jgi:hypothetical protein